MLVQPYTQTALVRKDSRYIDSTTQSINYVVASGNRSSWARKLQQVKGLQVKGRNLLIKCAHALCVVAADRTLCTTLLLPSGNSSRKTAHSTQPCQGQTAPTQPRDARRNDAELSCLVSETRFSKSTACHAFLAMAISEKRISCETSLKNARGTVQKVVRVPRKVTLQCHQSDEKCDLNVARYCAATDPISLKYW